MVKRNAEGAERSEGGGITQAGWYHFMVEEAEENDYSAKLVCNVSAGEHPEEVGRKLTHFVNFQASDPGDKQKQATITRMMFDVAEALGLEEKITGRIFTPEVREEMVKSSADVELDFNEAQGHQFIAKVDMEPYKGNDPEKKAKYADRLFPRIGFDIYHPLHDKAKDVPKDPDLMALFGVATESPKPAPAKPATSDKGSGNGNGKSQPQPAAAAPQTSSGDDDPWSVF